MPLAPIDHYLQTILNARIGHPRRSGNIRRRRDDAGAHRYPTALSSRIMSAPFSAII